MLLYIIIFSISNGIVEIHPNSELLYNMKCNFIENAISRTILQIQNTEGLSYQMIQSWHERQNQSQNSVIFYFFIIFFLNVLETILPDVILIVVNEMAFVLIEMTSRNRTCKFFFCTCHIPYIRDQRP